MNQNDWRQIYGDVPENFHIRLRETLDGLEDKKMKKRYKLSTVLVAAALVMALLAGAGIAATKLGVFHLLDTAEPIVPLEGAEALVRADLGTVKNDWATLKLEEAVFDGQGAMVQLHISPNDVQNYAMFNEMLQDAPEDVYDVEMEAAPVAIGRQTLSTDAGEAEIINEEQDRRYILDGVEVDIPGDQESALAAGVLVYEQDGRLYYADQAFSRVTGRKDGRKLMDYWPSVALKGSENAEAEGEAIFFDTYDAQEQADGSVIIWAAGYAETPLDADALEISCGGYVMVDGEKHELEAMPITLKKSEAERRAVLTPVGDGKGERFEILGGSISFTKVRAYLNLDYRYEPAAQGEEMGVTMKPYDANGNPITTGGGPAERDGDVYHQVEEMQSFEELPETIWFEAKVIGEDVTLGRVECKLTEE